MKLNLNNEEHESNIVDILDTIFDDFTSCSEEDLLCSDVLVCRIFNNITGEYKDFNDPRLRNDIKKILLTELKETVELELKGLE